MRLHAKLAALALAALLTLVLALALSRGRADARRAAAVLIAPPPVTADVPMKDVLSAHRAVADQRIGSGVDPAKARRPRLWDKGEALGGGASDQVDKATGTPAALNSG